MLPHLFRTEDGAIWRFNRRALQIALKRILEFALSGPRTLACTVAVRFLLVTFTGLCAEKSSPAIEPLLPAGAPPSNATVPNDTAACPVRCLAANGAERAKAPSLRIRCDFRPYDFQRRLDGRPSGDDRFLGSCWGR